jgi:hypothetical protein
MPATNRKSYKDYLSGSSKARDQLEELQHEIYDRPMPIEMQQQYALVAFVNSESLRAASMACGVPTAQLTKWAKMFNWDSVKRDHYEKVALKTQSLLDVEEVDRKAEVCKKLLDTIEDTIEMQIDDQDITEVERAKAVKDLVDAHSKLSTSGLSKEDARIIPGVSTKTQNNFFNQFNVTEDEEGPEKVVDITVDGEYQEMLEEIIESK